MKKLSINKILVLIAFPLIMVVVITIHSQIGAQDHEDVILDYEVSKGKAVTQNRKEKNKRFNHSGSYITKRLIKEFPDGAGDTVTIDHWWRGLSALPIEKSDAIVIGTVTNRNAFLSEDETNIYTEYEVKIEEVLKDSTESLKVNDIFPFIRDGGSVRFKSGKIQKYKIKRHGVLKKNHRYLIFLGNRNSVDLFIPTGYKLSGNKVVPVDGQDNKDPRSTLPFDKYLNADADALLRDIQIALEANRIKGGTE